MKCMMSVDNKHIKRVSDEKATELFGEGWRYVAKSVWKEKVRDIGIEHTHDKEPHNHDKTKSNKMSKSQKRHLKKSKK